MILKKLGKVDFSSITNSYLKLQPNAVMKSCIVIKKLALHLTHEFMAHKNCLQQETWEGRVVNFTDLWLNYWRDQCILATLLELQKRKITPTAVGQSTCLYKDAKFFHLLSITKNIGVLLLKTQRTLTAPEKQWISTPNHSSLSPSHLTNFD